MRRQRFPEAIELFEGHLQTQPDDTRALLRLGVCHLLNGSERAFLAIYERARRTLERLRDIPEDLARLWAKYRSLMLKVTASALIVGGVGTLPGCTKTGSETKPHGGPQEVAGDQQPASPSVADDVAPGPADAGETAHDTPPPPPDAAPAEKPKPEPKPGSMHRYSGGVYLEPKPEPKPGSMHKYSGGVYLKPSTKAIEELEKETGGKEDETEPRPRE